MFTLVFSLSMFLYFSFKESYIGVVLWDRPGKDFHHSYNLKQKGLKTEVILKLYNVQT